MNEADLRSKLEHLRHRAPDPLVIEAQLLRLLGIGPLSVDTVNCHHIQQTREVVVGGVMLDIGANVGQSSIPRVLLGDFAQVYAAEPGPETFEQLKRNIEMYGLHATVRASQLAIGARVAVAAFAASHHSKSGAVAVEKSSRSIETNIRTVDDWLLEQNVDPQTVTFVKSDTNGFELEVLAGAADLLARRRAVWQVECAPECLARYGVAVKDFCAALQNHFTHMIDIGRKATGQRVRPIAELPVALEYLSTLERRSKAPLTDLLLFNL